MTRVQWDNRRGHIVRTAILAELGGDEESTERVMKLLNDMRVVAYNTRDTLPLLSVPGRALVLICEYQGLSTREIAVRLGVHESNAQRAMTNLTTNGLVQRQKVDGRNSYLPNRQAILKHPDAWRFGLALADLVEEAPEPAGDIRVVEKIGPDWLVE